MRLQFVLAAFFGLFLAACGGDASAPKANYQALNLEAQGIPFSIQAPAGAEVQRVGNLVPSVFVRQDSTYEISIDITDATSADPAKIKAELLQEVKSSPSFKQVVQEDERGFIFEAAFDGHQGFNFRYVHLKGNQAYICQTSMVRQFSLERVKQLYAAVQ